MKQSIETYSSQFSKTNSSISEISNSNFKLFMRTYMMMHQKQIQFKSNCLTKDSQILRSDLIYGLIYDICSTMKLHPSTYFRTISLFDIILSVYQIPLEKINIIFLTCLSLASKINENFDRYIDISMIKKLTPNYSIEQLMSLELKLFSKLNFNINFPTSFDFLQILIHSMEKNIIVDQKLVCKKSDLKMIKALSEENLLNLLVEGSVIKFSANLISLSVLVLVLTKLGKIQIFENFICQIISYENEEFQGCFAYSREILQKINLSFFM